MASSKQLSEDDYYRTLSNNTWNISYMIDEKDITCVICCLKDITHEIKQYDYKLQYTSDLELIIYPIHSQSEICLHCLAV